MSPHGEEADGVRLAAPGMTAGLAATDWVVLGGYFALVAWLALVVSRGKRTTSDYFLAGRTLPSWAVALSIIATETSAVTFIGVPRKAYDGDWTFLQLVFGFVLGRLFLAAFMVQVFFRHEVVTVYGYLEKRFGAGARTLAALLFLAGRVVASGVRLFAGCLALQAAAGLPDNALTLAVVILGGLGAVLATVGGVRAVVWTDVLLGLTFITAAGAAAVFLAAGLPGGVSGLLQSPELSAKLAVFDWSLKLDSPNTFLAGIAGGFFLTLATHGTDQDIAQRYLTCRDSRTGGRSVVGSAVLLLPLMALLLAVGTLLYFYYLGRPVPEPVEKNRNLLFPLFIVRELPRGLSGFVMAGLLAASLSSLMSVLNALSASTVSDFYRPWRERRRPPPESAAAGEDHFFRAARAASLLWGVALIAVALAFQGSDNNILDVALQALTYFYGALLGTFLLAIFTRRGSGASVAAGMCLSVPAVLLLQLRQFIALPATAPGGVRRLLESLPEGATRAVTDLVPAIAWPYWIIIGAAVSFAAGALGRGRAAAA